MLVLSKLASLGFEGENGSIHISDLRLLHKYIPHIFDWTISKKKKINKTIISWEETLDCRAPSYHIALLFFSRFDHQESIKSRSPVIGWQMNANSIYNKDVQGLGWVGWGRAGLILCGLLGSWAMPGKDLSFDEFCGLYQPVGITRPRAYYVILLIIKFIIF